MSDKRLVERLALGAAVGVAGTIALQGRMIATQRWLPTAMPQIRKDPGEFIVEKAKQSLPRRRPRGCRLPPRRPQPNPWPSVMAPHTCRASAFRC